MSRSLIELGHCSFLNWPTLVAASGVQAQVVRSQRTAPPTGNYSAGFRPWLFHESERRRYSGPAPISGGWAWASWFPRARSRRLPIPLPVGRQTEHSPWWTSKPVRLELRDWAVSEKTEPQSMLQLHVPSVLFACHDFDVFLLTGLTDYTARVQQMCHLGEIDCVSSPYPSTSPASFACSNVVLENKISQLYKRIEGVCL